MEKHQLELWVYDASSSLCFQYSVAQGLFSVPVFLKGLWQKLQKNLKLQEWQARVIPIVLQMYFPALVLHRPLKMIPISQVREMKKG